MGRGSLTLRAFGEVEELRKFIELASQIWPGFSSSQPIANRIDPGARIYANLLVCSFMTVKRGGIVCSRTGRPCQLPCHQEEVENGEKP